MGPTGLLRHLPHLVYTEGWLSAMSRVSRYQQYTLYSSPHQCIDSMEMPLVDLTEVMHTPVIGRYFCLYFRPFSTQLHFTFLIPPFPLMLIFVMIIPLCLSRSRTDDKNVF